LEKKKKEVEKQMAAVNLNGYTPKYGQDPEVFNHMYMNYINQLNSASDDSSSEASTPTSIAERPYSQQSSAGFSTASDAEEDRNT